MSPKNHDWQIGQPLPLIRPHSLAKHRVLDAYLKRYVKVLTCDPRRDQLRLTLVDGFSGGGRYLDSRTQEERPGSPLIMLEAMEQVAQEIQLGRKKPFNLDVQFFFVEKKHDAMEHLKKTLSETRFGRLVGERIHLIPGEFTDSVPEINSFIQKRGTAGRSIFLLDQFGYIDVPLPTIRTILSTLENAEIILTFAVDSLIDYLSTNDQTQETLQKLGISLPAKEIAVAKGTRDWRQVIQFALHREIPARTGAKYYTPFFLWSADSHRDLWFIHLSGHYRAKDVMLDLHWAENNAFAHYGRSGLNMLGYDQRQDPSLTGLGALPGFFFDQSARAASHQMLVNQLPEKMSQYRDGVQFHELFSQLTNDCPVSGEIMTEVLSDLARMGLVVVKDRLGTITRRAGPQHLRDIVIPTKQKLLTFGDHFH